MKRADRTIINQYEARGSEEQGINIQRSAPGVAKAEKRMLNAMFFGGRNFK